MINTFSDGGTDAAAAREATIQITIALLIMFAVVSGESLNDFIPELGLSFIPKNSRVLIKYERIIHKSVPRFTNTKLLLVQTM